MDKGRPIGQCQLLSGTPLEQRMDRRHPIVSGMVGDDDGMYIPFEIYTYKGDTIVEFNGGMFHESVDRKAVDDFLDHVLDKEVSWPALPAIPGPWQSRIPTYPDNVAFSAPKLLLPHLMREPHIHGPSLAVKLRERARKIARVKNKAARVTKTKSRHNSKPTLIISSNSNSNTRKTMR